MITGLRFETLVVTVTTSLMLAACDTQSAGTLASSFEADHPFGMSWDLNEAEISAIEEAASVQCDAARLKRKMQSARSEFWMGIVSCGSIEYDLLDIPAEYRPDKLKVGDAYIDFRGGTEPAAVHFEHRYVGWLDSSSPANKLNALELYDQIDQTLNEVYGAPLATGDLTEFTLPVRMPGIFIEDRPCHFWLEGMIGVAFCVGKDPHQDSVSTGVSIVRLDRAETGIALLETALPEAKNDPKYSSIYEAWSAKHSGDASQTEKEQ